MAEESEKRFKRAMDRIFTGPPPSPPQPPPASLPETPLPLKSKERASIGSLHKSSRMSLLKKIKQGPEIVDDKEVPAHQGACRPWDRGDLLRRLATFKSITWFGKPKVAGPVNCARKGWVNVDIDLLACEVCGARVSFPIPSSWSQQEVEKVAEGFGKKLDSGHKDLCPWKGNVCAETLAHFPPMPPQVLLGTFKDRCDALSVLSALPVISSAAIVTMKLAKGPEIESLLAQPPQATPHSGSIPLEIDAEGSSSSLVTSFYLSQRLISLCGWEPRLLPYVVDCEDNSKNSKVTSHSQSSSPSVVLFARQEMQPPSTSTNWDPSSVVLDCNLCGASVGLWSFAAVTPRQHVRRTSLPKRSVVEKGNEVGTCASCVGELDDGEDEDEEKKVSEDITSVCKASTQSGVLDLSLTIAGGPRPAYLDFRGLIPLPFPAVPAEASSSRRGGYARPQHSEVGDSVAPSEPTSENNGNNDRSVRKRKRNEKILAEQSVRGGWGFPNHSSVEAVDTRYFSRAENSAESVEMPRDIEDGNETNVGKDYGISVCMDNGRRSSSDVKEAGSKDVLETADSTGQRRLFNEGEKPDSVTGIIADGETQLSKRRNVSGKSVSGIENKLGECNRIKDRQDENVCNETQVAGFSSSTSANDTGKELTVKNLWEKEGKEFDPLLQHRHFCPWVNASTFVTEGGSEKRGSCGWQLTLDALSIPVVESESASASSLYKKADPLASVEKIFGSSSHSKRGRRVSG